MPVTSEEINETLEDFIDYKKKGDKQSAQEKKKQLEAFLIERLESLSEIIRKDLGSEVEAIKKNTFIPKFESYIEDIVNIQTTLRENRQLGKNISKICVNNIYRPFASLHVQLPNSNKKMQFIEQFLNSEKNIGFNALWVRRRKLAKTLLALKNNQEDRQFLAPEILHALLDNKNGFTAPDEKGKKLLARYARYQKNLNLLSRDIRKSLANDEVKQMKLDNLIQWLKNDKSDVDSVDKAKALIAKCSAIENIAKNLRNYCETPEVFTHYIEGLKRQLWLGYRSASLYAREAKIKLRIWKKQDKNSNQLQLHKDYGAVDGTEQKCIDLLITDAIDNFCNFNLLAEVTQQSTKASEQEYSVAVKATLLDLQYPQLEEDILPLRFSEYTIDHLVYDFNRRNPEIKYPKDKQDYNQEIDNWKQSRKFKSILFVFSPVTNKWEAHLLRNKAGDIEIKEIAENSPFWNELKTIKVSDKPTATNRRKLQVMLKKHSLFTEAMHKELIEELENLEELIEEITELAKSKFNSPATIYAVTPLAACDSEEIFDQLIRNVLNYLHTDALFNPHMIRGLALLIRYANHKTEQTATGSMQVVSNIGINQLKQILMAIFKVLDNFHKQRETNIKLQHLLMDITDALNAMVDLGLQDLDTEETNGYYRQLNDLEDYDNQELGFYKAYALQALARLPANSDFFKDKFYPVYRVIRDGAAIVSAVKDFSLNDLMDGLEDLYDDTTNIANKIARSFKRPWYKHLRSITAFIQGNDIKNATHKFQELLVILFTHQEISHILKTHKVMNDAKWFSLGLIKSLEPVLLEGKSEIRLLTLMLLRKLAMIEAAPLELTAQRYFSWPKITAVQHKVLELLNKHIAAIAVNNKDNLKDKLFAKESHLLQSSVIELTEIMQKEEKPANLLTQTKTRVTTHLEQAKAFVDTQLKKTVIGEYLLEQSADSEVKREAEIIHEVSQTKINQRKKELFTEVYKQKFLLKYCLDSLWRDAEEKFKIDKISADSLNYYVPLDGAERIEELSKKNSSLFKLHEKIIEVLAKEDDNKLILIQGRPGSGKSLFARHLTKTFWENYVPGKSSIPLFINLGQLTDPFHKCIENVLEEIERGFQELSTEDLNKLRGETKFVFIFDGYDEIPTFSNLYVTNKLYMWKKAKVIITCRTDTLGGDYDALFNTSFNSQSKLRGFIEFFVASFKKEQRNEYVSKSMLTKYQELLKAVMPQYVVKGKFNIEDIKSEEILNNLEKVLPNLCSEIRSNIVGVKQQLKELPGVKNLIKIPFHLRILMDILPQILQQKDKTVNVSRLLIYRTFIEEWHKQKAEELIASGEKFEKGDNPKKSFQQYGMGLAFVMLLRCQTALQEVSGHFMAEVIKDKELKHFFNNELLSQTSRKGVPLIMSGSAAQFLHKTIQEYYAACFLFEQIKRPRRLDPMMPLNRKKQTENNQEVLLLDKEHSILSFLQEMILEDKNLIRDRQEALFTMIKHSATNKTYAPLAANAITLLNFMGVSFSGRNLSGMCIPGADLTRAICDHTNFSDTDLTAVRFQNAWLRFATLTNAELQNVIFGEKPYLKHDKSLLSAKMAFSPNGEWLATPQAHLIYVWDVKSASRLNALNYNAKMSSEKKIKGEIKGFQFLNNGKLLASVIGNRLVLWDMEKRRPADKHVPKNLPENFTTLQFSTNGKWLALVHGKEKVALIKTNDQKANIDSVSLKKSADVIGLEFSNELLAIILENNNVLLYDLLRKEITELKLDNTSIEPKFRFGPNNDLWAASSTDNQIFLHKLFPKINEKKLMFSNFTGQLTDFCFSWDGSNVAFGSTDGLVRIGDKEGGKLFTHFGHNAAIIAVQFSPDGKTLASASNNNIVRLWDAAINIANLHNDACHNSEVIELRQLPSNGDSRKILKSKSEGKTLYFDVATGFLVDEQEIEKKDSEVESNLYQAAIHENVQQTVSVMTPMQQLLQNSSTAPLPGDYVRIIFSNNQSAKNFQRELDAINNRAERKIVKLPPNGMDHPRERYAIDLANDEWNNVKSVGNITDNNNLQHVSGLGKKISSPLQSPSTTRSDFVKVKSDTLRAEINSPQMTVKVIKNYRTGNSIDLLSLEYSTPHVRDAKVSPKGDCAVIGYVDGKIELFNLYEKHAESNEQLNMWFQKNKQNGSVTLWFHPAKSIFASVSKDNTTRLWYLDHRRTFLLQGYQEEVNCVRFNEYGFQIALVTDTTLYLWETNNQQRILNAPKEYKHRITSHIDCIKDVLFLSSSELKIIQADQKEIIIDTKNEFKIMSEIRAAENKIKELNSENLVSGSVMQPDVIVNKEQKNEDKRQYQVKDENGLLQLVMSEGEERSIALEFDKSINEKDKEEFTKLVKTYNRLKFTPNKEIFASFDCNNPHVVFLWEIESQNLKKLTGNFGDIALIEFLDDDTLATGSKDGSIYLWQRPPIAKPWQLQWRSSPHASLFAQDCDIGKAKNVWESDRSLLRQHAATGDPLLAGTPDWTDLHLAAANGDAASVGRLLETSRGIEMLEEKDNKKKTALHLAAHYGYDEIVKLLLAKSANYHAEDSDDRVPGYYAKNNNNPKKEILNILPWKDDEMYPGGTFLHIAIEEGNDSIWNFLINEIATHNLRQKAELNQSEDTHGRTPLTTAIAKRRKDYVADLLKVGVDLNQRDSNGSAALHYAIEPDCKDIFLTLLKHKNNSGLTESSKQNTLLNFYIRTTTEGFTPLHLIVQKGLDEFLEALLSEIVGVDINILKESDIPKNIESHINTQQLIIGDVKDIIEKINTPDNEDKTPLHFAVQLDNSKIVDLLLLIDRTIAINKKDKYGRKPLHYAVQAGKENHINNLLITLRSYSDSVIYLNEKDNEGMTLLHIALTKNHVKIFKQLLQEGANPCLTDNINQDTINVMWPKASGKTPLHLLLEQAPTKDNHELISFLLEKFIVWLEKHSSDALKNSEPLSLILNRNLLELAAEFGDASLIEKLLNIDTNWDIQYEKSALLSWASQHANKDILVNLLQAKINHLRLRFSDLKINPEIYLPKWHSKSLLQWASECGKKEDIIDQLLVVQIEWLKRNPQEANESVMSGLLENVLYHADNYVKNVLDLNTELGLKLDILKLADKLKPETSEKLIKRHIEWLDISKNAGIDPKAHNLLPLIEQHVKNKRDYFISKLLKRQYDWLQKNLRDNLLENPGIFHLVADKKNLLEYVQKYGFPRTGFSINNSTENDGKQFMSLQATYYKKYKEIKAETHQEIDQKDKEKTLLYLAVENNDTTMIEMLLVAGADPTVECTDKFKIPLKRALENESSQLFDVDIVKHLLSADYTKLGNDWIEILCSLKSKNNKVINLLVEAQIKEMDNYYKKHNQAHPKINPPDALGFSLLQHAAVNEDADQTTKLLTIGAGLDEKLLQWAMDEDNNKVLLTLLQGQYKFLSDPQKIKSNPEIHTLKFGKKTLLQWVETIHSKENIKKFLQAQCGWMENHKNFAEIDKGHEGKTLLHWAAEYGFLDIVKQLLKMGANPNVKEYEKNGKKLAPIDLAAQKLPTVPMPSVRNYHYDVIQELCKSPIFDHKDQNWINDHVPLLWRIYFLKEKTSPHEEPSASKQESSYPKILSGLVGTSSVQDGSEKHSETTGKPILQTQSEGSESANFPEETLTQESKSDDEKKQDSNASLKP